MEFNHNAPLDAKQVEGIEKITNAGGGIVWMNVGDGKTRVALIAAGRICPDHNVHIIVARRAAFYDWESEVATLQLPFKVVAMEDVPLNPVFFNPTFILVSEAKLCNDIVLDILSNLHMSNQIGTIIVDELWLFKNPKAQKSKALARFTKYHPTIGISGTVMTARDLVDIYGQVAAVGKRNALARTTSKFIGQYQTGIKQGSYYQWYPKKGAYAEIMAKIEPFTFLHMPPLSRVKTITRYMRVKPTDQQVQYLKELKETAAIEGFFELNSMAAIITKAQQISDGWLVDSEGQLAFFPSAKVDRTIALIRELMQTEYKMVIWCAFRNDIARLQYELEQKLGEKQIATLQSGKPFDQELWRRKDCRICLATEASGSSVNHFAQVPYAIYFSQDFKWTSQQQSQGRHTRRSSEHDAAYFIFMHTENSLDAQVHFTVKNSALSESSFLKAMDIRSWLKGGRVDK